MGRPNKTGLDYFPLDVYFLKDKKLEALFNRMGPQALAVYLGILCKVYEGEGYYAVWDEDNLLSVSRMAWCTQEYVDDVIMVCLEKRLFSMKPYLEHGVLTSEGIQRRYLKAIKERIRKMKQPDVQLNLRRSLWLLSEQETKKLKIEMELAEGITTAVTQERGTEEEGFFPEKLSKEKERKKEESIQEQRSGREEDAPPWACAPAAPASAMPMSATLASAMPHNGTEWRYRISVGEKQELVDQYGIEAVETKMLRLQEWASAKGFWVKYPMDRLRSWLAEDVSSEKMRRDKAERAAQQPAVCKKTGAHAYAQREYTEDFYDSLYTPLEELNS